MSMTDGLTAYTAPGVVFATDEELKTHYRTEWHRHNLKRKVANLKPLTKEAFEARQAAASSAAEAGAGGKQRRGRGGRDGTAGGAEKERQAAPGSKAAYYQAAAEMTDDELLAARVAAAPELHPGLDLFSPHEAESLEANLAHMAQAYSFTVPYASYVKDVPGLIRYLQEKVYIGCVALVEGKQFHSWQAAQGHMVRARPARAPPGQRCDKGRCRHVGGPDGGGGVCAARRDVRQGAWDAPALAGCPGGARWLAQDLYTLEGPGELLTAFPPRTRWVPPAWQCTRASPPDLLAAGQEQPAVQPGGL